MRRPYVVASCAVSVDGYLDDASPSRLVLSNAEDLDRVDALRAGCDAILVGAQTIRRDNPRLRVRAAERRRARVAAGLAPDPIRVALSTAGELDVAAAFFRPDPAPPLVYVTDAGLAKATTRLGAVATVVGAGDALDLWSVLADLDGRGIRRLLVEGGGRTLTAFLAAGLVDEWHLVVAPFLVGDPAAPRAVGPGAFPADPAHPMRLVEVRRMADRVLLRYLL